MLFRSILEVGFGTGLNAFLTLAYAKEQKKSIDYSTIELYPLKKEIIEELNFPELSTNKHKHLFYALHNCEWETHITISNYFTIKKINSDFTKAKYDKKFDLIYFDAFAPDKQPEMWTQEIFSYLYEQTNYGGILTTYCAKGVVRRMLQTAGFTTERIPGPPGKRDMLRATKR